MKDKLQYAVTKLKNTVTVTLWVLLLIILCTGAASWFMSKHVYKCKPVPQSTAMYDSIVLANKRKIDSAAMVNIRLSEINNEYLGQIKRLEQSREYLSKKYINLYYEINNTTDSGQLAITQELLSRLGYYHAKGY